MIIHQTRQLMPGQKIRVLIVDDSVVIRRLVCHALEEDDAIEVVGSASNGVVALERIPQLRPDVITLDIEMPEMDGLQMLRRVRAQYPAIRIVMFSTLTERGATATLDALTLGADDYVAKASNAGSLDISLAHLRGELVPKIRQFFRTSIDVSRGVSCAQPETIGTRPAARAVAIGVSTGGPAALGEIVPQFPAGFPLPIFIVQHMPPLFTLFLAERLAGVGRLAAREAAAGEPARAGTIYVAPGDYHMTVTRQAGEVRTVLDQRPPENSCRPSVDVLFQSLAEVYGAGVIAVVLTGMGRDGMRGAQSLKACGAYVVAQDEATSVVWGMPGSVVEAGAADQVVPLSEIVPTIQRRL